MTLDKFIYPFNRDLPKDESGVAEKNSLNSYFPLRTNDKPCDWEAVIGLLLQVVMGKRIGEYTIDQFQIDCESGLKEEKLIKNEFWDVLKKMYFDENDILKVSPKMLLFKAKKGEYTPVDERVAEMFANHLLGLQLEDFKIKSNFLEREFLAILDKKLEENKFTSKTELPYLPELTRVIRKDFKFLSIRPKYLLNEFENFLSFYAFIYTSQLSLSLPDWRKGEEPKAKPLYFIMDHERASKERTYLKKYGYQLMSNSFIRLFPMLTMLEMLQPSKSGEETVKVPLWEISRRIQESKFEHLEEHLKQFAFAFKKKRSIPVEMKDANSALDWLGNILDLSEAQFKFGGKKGLHKKYASSVAKIMATPFIKNRGRSGNVLVLNQDYIILLTNLVVGEKDKLRFHELIAAFKQRGIFVDKQTEQELIKFYERIGNVERMSDSGDAVYVRKTI
ncbi:DNA phosphorothioation-dependent restriction protein DptG [Photobacterium angustum]|uniref:DNA phosphorothioation-dependent restriction protein DptG n=1 Tax=Photobacterium angustum TaxID=661 RepID=UPI0005E838C4|nr:DNA phosphorothioation-dependent restriction protein DptG [Photobacterium angustum]KJG02103.1 dnd system-associated protein 1 [Photobacterium angustum]PSV65855.1 DNA phosphorothioation-dependent restriction protein DptG [Photobacterium angustum]